MPAALGIAQGDEIELATPTGSIRVRANLSQMIRPGDVHMYHGYPEADVNTLLEGDYLDPISGFPGYKAALCAVRKVPAKTATPGGAEMSYALRLDLDRCVGCMACAVACMDQNDLEIGGGADRLAAGLHRRIGRLSRGSAALRLHGLHALRGRALSHGLSHRSHLPGRRDPRRADRRRNCASAATAVRWPVRSGCPASAGTAPCRNATCAAPASNTAWSRRACGSARARPCTMETRTR